MLSRLLEVDAAQRRIETELAQERQALTDCREALQLASRAFKCPVCFTNDVSQVLVPCGHTLCEECLGQMGQFGRKCPFCRAPFTNNVKLFLPEGSGGGGDEGRTVL